MAAYWALFSLPIMLKILGTTHPFLRAYGWSVAAVILYLMIGFRDNIGCDWLNYQLNYEDIVSAPLDLSSKMYEPGHILVNLLAYNLGYGVNATNIIYAAVFVAGLFSFVTRQPMPVFALLLSIPYLVIVVAMGYTRQATAIGVLFFAFKACEERRIKALVFFVILASLFHRSALVFLILLPIVRGFRFDFTNIAFVLCAPIGLFLTQSDVNRYIESYVDSGMVSDGGFIRLLLTAFAGCIFLSLRSYFRLFRDYNMFLFFALASIFSFPLNTIASTAVDRIALYLIPFQIAVFARLPLAFRKQDFRIAAATGVALLFTAQLYVWLNYATNNSCWIPYKNLIF